MELETDQLGPSTARVICRGRFNMSAAPDFRRSLDDVLESGRSRVVVDLAGTSFIDSSGLGALIAGLKKARQAGGDLRIAGPSEQVKMVLDLTNLSRVLRPHADVAAATRDW
jgi:anti-sigma B factor antagonist